MPKIRATNCVWTGVCVDRCIDTRVHGRRGEHEHGSAVHCFTFRGVHGLCAAWACKEAWPSAAEPFIPAWNSRVYTLYRCVRRHVWMCELMSPDLFTTLGTCLECSIECIHIQRRATWGHWPCTAHDKQLTDEGRQRIFTRRMSGPVSAHWHGHVFSACVWLMSMSVQVVRNTHGGTACVLLHGPCVASARSSQVSKNVIPRGLGNHG